MINRALFVCFSLPFAHSTHIPITVIGAVVDGDDDGDGSTSSTPLLGEVRIFLLGGSNSFDFSEATAGLGQLLAPLSSVVGGRVGGGG